MSSHHFPVLDDEEKSNGPPLADSRKAPEWIAETKRILARGPAGTLHCPKGVMPHNTNRQDSSAVAASCTPPAL
jgi:hypothetical protein